MAEVDVDKKDGENTPPFKPNVGSSSGTVTPLSGSQPAASKPEPQKLYVDGKEVNEKEWLKAAGENGYDLSRLSPNYRPDISTRKHGQK